MQFIVEDELCVTHSNSLSFIEYISSSSSE